MAACSRLGSCATVSREPCQVREEAAISGSFHVPRCILEAVINHACISLFYCTDCLVHPGIFSLLFFLFTMRRHPFLWPISHFIENGVPALSVKWSGRSIFPSRSGVPSSRIGWRTPISSLVHAVRERPVWQKFSQKP